MNTVGRLARRYHWLSSRLKSFTEEPHTSVCGKNIGPILNLTDKNATPTKSGILTLTGEAPGKIMKEVNLVMPTRHNVKSGDVDMKRLGAALILAHETGVEDFESLLLLQGVGPRTLQSLTLVSEVIHGTPSRFSDPARFSFAHGGKDGHPFPVPTKVYDETINIFDKAIHSSKLGYKDKSEALKNLSKVSASMGKKYTPRDYFDDLLKKENADSYKYGGKTVYGDTPKPEEGRQLTIWDQ